jgi:hypothetical protein
MYFLTKELFFPQMARICSNYLVLIAQNCILCLQSRANNTSQKSYIKNGLAFLISLKQKNVNKIQSHNN